MSPPCAPWCSTPKMCKATHAGCRLDAGRRLDAAARYQRTTLSSRHWRARDVFKQLYPDSAVRQMKAWLELEGLRWPEERAIRGLWRARNGGC